MKRPLLLICNDDGIRAPGIFTLWKALKESDLFDLMVIAPEVEKSGNGCALTWDRPILIREIDWHDGTKAWSVDGTPADCVKMGLRVIQQKIPDLIVSGINAGSNAGRNVLHSGTIGAVIEGLFRGIPGIAFSCESGENPNFHVAERYIVPIVEYVLKNPFQNGTFLNVNIPHAEEIRGFRMTRQGKGRWIEDPLFHLETQNGPTYWLGGKPEETDEMEESDIALLKEGYLTAVPLHIHELTDKNEMANRKRNFETEFFQQLHVEKK